MEIQFLADRPEAVTGIAEWYFDEWGHSTLDNSVEKISERIRGMLNRDKIPLHLIAVDGAKVLGVVQLKIREMDIYPDREFWLGGVFTAPSARGRGLATSLIRRALALAQAFGVKKLYLQTERLDGGLYVALGWRPIEKVHYHGLYVLVMERDI